MASSPFPFLNPFLNSSSLNLTKTVTIGGDFGLKMKIGNFLQALVTWLVSCGI